MRVHRHQTQKAIKRQFENLLPFQMAVLLLSFTGFIRLLVLAFFGLFIQPQRRITRKPPEFRKCPVPKF